MKYYRLHDDLEFPRRWHLDAPTTGSGATVISELTSGRLFRDNTRLSVTTRPGKRMDFTLAAFDVPVVSSALRDVICACVGDDVQMVPVDVQGADCDHYVLNVLRTCDCLDEGRSEFTNWSERDGRPDRVGQYRMVTKLYVDPRCIGKVSIFRISRWLVPLIVSDTVKRAIEDRGFGGVVFQPVS